MRRQLSVSQGKGSHQEPWAWTSSCQNYEGINVCCLSHPVYGILLCSPSGLSLKTKIILLSLNVRGFFCQKECSSNRDLSPYMPKENSCVCVNRLTHDEFLSVYKKHRVATICQNVVLLVFNIMKKNTQSTQIGLPFYVI